jgi:hypothetical protein
MRKYRIVAQDEIDGLAAKIASLIGKEISRMGQVIAIPDGQSSVFDPGPIGQKRKRSPGKRLGGKSMSDWIYESIDLPEFSTSEAAEILKKIIPDWTNPRATDSIRIALRNDPNRFERLPNGKFKKK